MNRILFVLSFIVSLIVGPAIFAETSSNPFCIPAFMDCTKLTQPSLPTLPGTLPGSGGNSLADLVKKNFSNSYGQRNYYVYVPKNLANTGKANGLFVMLHGCFQSATAFSQETGMIKVAEKYGFIAVFPEQDYSNNVWKCWNWFKPENQARNTAELSIIKGITDETLSQYSVNLKNIFIGGLSAGGAIASNAFACHRDLFTGLGVHSGLEYMAATSESEAHDVTGKGSSQDLNVTAQKAVECTGVSALPGAVMVIHGTKDEFVNPINSDHVVTQFSNMNDLLDDGKDNNSQSTTLISTKQQSTNGYSYDTLYFGGNGSVRVAQVKVSGLAHAWCGAGQSGQYADLKGPSAAELMWIFLSNYSQK
jgi:poly(hydroxyalkanoate) depolymerase family esterase